jgi:predicted glycoside hydrolase/deacetylase ChbG (UPF0249 family)
LKRLIVTADDVGLHPGMTEGALRAHQDGIVTACSIVANGAAFDSAVDRLRDVPALEAGVHLTLVAERPLTEMVFPKSYAGFVAGHLLMSAAVIERELRAQIEKVLRTGLRITHLNGHQHLHLLPRLYSIVERIARDHRISYIRVVNDRGGRAALPRRLSIAALSALGRRVDPTRRTIGVAEAGHLHDVEHLLDSVEGVTELVAHPGVAVTGYDWGYEWEEEMRALCDPALREALVRRKITLVRPSDIMSSLAHARDDMRSSRTIV